MRAGHAGPCLRSIEGARRRKGLIPDGDDDCNGHDGQGLPAVVTAGLRYRAAPLVQALIRSKWDGREDIAEKGGVIFAPNHLLLP